MIGQFPPPSPALNCRRQSSYIDYKRNIGARSTLSINKISYETNAKKIRHTLCSYFILSLGCCDLLICALIMPVVLVIESGYFDVHFSTLFGRNDFYSVLWCKCSYYLIQIPLVLEIEILLTIAIDRYSSVFHPIKIYFFDRTKSKITLIAQIFLSSVLSLPNLAFYSTASR